MGEPLRVIPVLAAGLSLVPGFLISARGLSNPANAALLASALAAGAVNAGGGLMASGYGAYLFALGQAMLAASLLVFSVTFGRVEKKERLARWSPLIAVLLSALVLSVLVTLPEGPVLINEGVFEMERGGALFQGVTALAIIISLMQLEGTFRALPGPVRNRAGAVILGVGAIGACNAFLSLQLLVFGYAGKAAVAAAAAVTVAAAVRMALSLAGGFSALDISVSRPGLGRPAVVFSAAAFAAASLLFARFAGSSAGDYFTAACIGLTALSAALLSLLHARRSGAGWLAPFIGKRHDYKERWIEATEKISSRTDPADVKAVLSEMVTTAIGASTVHIWLYDDGQGCFFSTSSKLEQRFRRIPVSHSIVEHMLSGCVPFYISECETENEETSADGPESLSLSTGAVICAPLAAGRELIGFLTAGEESAGRGYSKNDLDLLRAVATQAAVQIKNLRLGQDLLEVKEVDAFSRMSSFVMHDLKNFTNSLALLSHNARSNMASPEFQREAVKAIDLTVARMKGLIEKMAGGGGQLRIEKRPEDLTAVLKRAVERLPSGSADRLKISDDGGSAICSMDPDAIETVFFNMLMNACDAIGSEGEIRVTFQSGQGHATVKVSDTGSGIPKTLLEKGLFRPFATTKKNGFGVGLYHCKAVMEAHGGRIEVESEEGTGTVFTLRFPLHAEERFATNAG